MTTTDSPTRCMICTSTGQLPVAPKARSMPRFACSVCSGTGRIAPPTATAVPEPTTAPPPPEPPTTVTGRRRRHTPAPPPQTDRRHRRRTLVDHADD